MKLSYSLPWVLVACLVLASTSFNWVYHLRVVDRLDQFKKAQEDVHTLRTTWTDGKLQHTWTSTLGETAASESIEALSLRHKSEIIELQRALRSEK